MTRISGGASTRSKMPSRFPATYPRALVRGDGPYVWDTDDTKYVDFMCGNASVTQGHAHSDIAIEMAEYLGRGIFGLPHPLEEQVGARLCEALGFGMVRWACTGSEANEGAMRIARVVTGRDQILRTDYIGWFGTHVAAEPQHPGVPDSYADTVGLVPPNDLPALIKELDRGHIAAVILEPGRTWTPHPGYLLDVMTEAHEAGALVVFDCVVTFGRFSLRGWVDEWLDSEGVRPDMVTVGKALTNGTFPVSAILGSRALMDPASQWVSGTYAGHPAGLAAVNAVLNLYEREPIIDRIWACGRQLIDMMDGISQVGLPPHPIFRFPVAEQATTFYTTLAEHGVLAHPNGGWNPSAAHDTTAMQLTAEAIEKARQAAGV